MGDEADLAMDGRGGLHLVFDGRAGDLEAWSIIDCESPATTRVEGTVANPIAHSQRFVAEHVSGLTVAVTSVAIEGGALGAKQVHITNNRSVIDSAALNAVPLSSLLTEAATLEGGGLVYYNPQLVSTAESPLDHGDAAWRTRITWDVQYLRLIGASVARSLAATYFDGDVKAARSWMRQLQRLGRI